MGTVTRLTDEEFLNLEDEPGKQELLDGELIAVPPAKKRHHATTKRFFMTLVRSHGEDRVCFEAGYRLKSGWLQPNVSVNWPDQTGEDWFQGPLMIAIEVVSPSNTRGQIARKTAAYLKGGAAEVWNVYVDFRSMKVHRKDTVLEITGDYHCELLNLTIRLAELIPA